MADAQVWTVIALLAAAVFAIVIEMRRMSERMADGFALVHRELGDLRADFGNLRGEFGDLRGEFGKLRGEFGELRGEFGELRGDFRALSADVRSDIAGLRTDLGRHVEGHDHRPSA